MSEWKEIKLGDVITFQRGHDLPKTDMVIGEFPVAGSNGIIGFHNKATTKGPGVTIGRSGNIGTPIFYSKDYWAHNTVLFIKDFKNSFPKFIYYFLKSFDFSQFNAGSAVPTLNRNHIHELNVKVPTLPEQKLIAETLSSLDDKIDLLHRQNKTLEQLAETLFRQWFIEEAEESWEGGTINSLIEIQSGFAFKSTDFVEQGKYKLVTIKNVQDGYLDLSSTNFINEIPKRMPEYCLLQQGDILLSLTGNVGRCCLITEENLFLNQRVAKLRAKNNRDWGFTYIMFRQTTMRRMLEELAKGTAQANLSPIETGKMEIQIPPKELLQKYSLEATPLLEKVLKNKNQINTLTKLRDTLLPKLMSGEIRLNH